MSTTLSSRPTPPSTGARRATTISPTRSLYLNRELSWLDFNDRVLQLAEDERVPLLERVKFCAIYTTNLDEFYMVRVAGLRDQIDAGVETRPPTGAPVGDDRGRSASACSSRAVAERRLRSAICARRWPSTTSAWSPSTISTPSERASSWPGTSRRSIFPALTPLAVAPGRPFPYISNLSLSLAVLVRDPADRPDGVRAREGAHRDPAALRARSASDAARSLRWRT